MVLGKPLYFNSLVLLVSIFLLGCGDEGVSPPSLPSFNLESDTGGTQGADVVETILDGLDDNPDAFDKPDGGEEEDAGDSSEGTDGEEGGEEGGTDTTEGGESTQPDTTEESCLEQDDPIAWCEESLSLTGCDTAYCSESGECMVETVSAPDCCITSEDCDDGNSITFDQCLGDGLSCTNLVDPTQCANNVSFLDSNFDDGTLQGWTVQDEDGDETVGWQIDTTRTQQGPFGFYFGNTNCPTYYSGDLNPDCTLPGAEGASQGQSGSLISPEFTIPENSAVLLSFFVFAEFELFLDPSMDECAPGTTPYDDPMNPCWSPELEAEDADNMSVWISYYDDLVGESVMVELWNVVDLVPPFPAQSKGTDGVFDQIGVDLSTFAGKTVRIIFEAHADEYFNFDFEGAYVDSILVRTGCGEALCDNNSDCQSPNTCKSFECTSLANSESGFCFGASVEADCSPCPGGTHPECNDGNDCTTDLCSPQNTCTFSALAEEACCEGGNTNGPYDFESGLPAGWTVSGGTNGVGWTVIQTDGEDTDLYFGNPESGSYDADGARVVGSVTTGFFTLPLAPYALLSTMEIKLATEYEIEPYVPGDPESDKLTIHVLYNLDGLEVETLVFDSIADVDGATGYQQGKDTALFENVGFDVSFWQGQAIRLRFTFDSMDGFNNDYAGVFIDNLSILEVCEEPSCTLDDQCDDGLGCTNDVCLAGFCLSSKDDPTCCESDSECNDANPCTNDNCVESIGCVNEPVADPNCCFETSNLFADFEGSDFGWTFDSISENVVWSFLSGGSASEGSGFLYFGDPSTGTYEAFEGTLSLGTALSPAFKIQPNGGSALSFDLFMETEWDNFPIPCDTNCQALLGVNDVLTVRVRDQFFVDTEVWNSAYINNSTKGEYITVELNLSQWAGEDIQVMFEFKTTDPLFNDYAGVRIDNLGTYVLCSETIECFSDLDCEDEDEDTCTVPTCTANTCSEEPVLKLPECCFETPILNANFDSGTKEGFEIVGLTCGAETFSSECFQNDNATVRWQVSDLQSHSPNQSLWFGNEVSGDYNDEGLAVKGWATSSSVTLFPGLSSTLDMWVYLDVEEYSEIFQEADSFQVAIVPSFGGETIIWDKSEMNPADMGSWVNIQYDLSGFDGQTISIEVSFDSYDNQDNNNGVGVFTDDIQIIQGCSVLAD